MSKSAPCFALCSKAFWLVWQEQKTVLSVFTTSRGAVNGGVHWFVNKTADGRLLVMFNNSGIERSVEKGKYIFINLKLCRLWKW
ncbi:MAG: hypothetical protein J6D06_08380 [Clostridia bacterium]|nr:hypothetical protein [Clostridia bacterium]